jgi:hypothetical protein
MPVVCFSKYVSTCCMFWLLVSTLHISSFGRLNQIEVAVDCISQLALNSPPMVLPCCHSLLDQGRKTCCSVEQCYIRLKTSWMLREYVRYLGVCQPRHACRSRLSGRSNMRMAAQLGSNVVMRYLTYYKSWHISEGDQGLCKPKP